MLADARMIKKIRRNICGRFVYRGTTSANVFGYPTDRQFEIWNDTITQKTYHIPVWNVKYLSKAVFQRVSRQKIVEEFPETAEWPIVGEHSDRFGCVLGNGVYLFPDFDFEKPAFEAI